MQFSRQHLLWRQKPLPRWVRHLPPGTQTKKQPHLREAEKSFPEHRTPTEKLLLLLLLVSCTFKRFSGKLARGTWKGKPAAHQHSIFRIEQLSSHFQKATPGFHPIRLRSCLESNYCLGRRQAAFLPPAKVSLFPAYFPTKTQRDCTSASVPIPCFLLPFLPSPGSDSLELQPLPAQLECSPRVAAGWEKIK